MLRTQITLGILLMIASIATAAYIATTEEARLVTTQESQLARRIENGAALYHTNCIRCHGEHAEGVPGLCPPLNSLTLFEQRVEETGWSGSVFTYLVNTIRGGRLNSTRPEYVGESASGMAMPFWGQDYGGPLRNDQIDDIAYFLMNFGETEVDEGSTAEATPIPEDADLTAIGLELYAAQGCAGCHALDAAGAAGAVGPTHNGMGATAAERVEDPSYTGEATDAAGYIRESLLNPGAHVVEGYSNIMPAYPLPDDQINALVQMLLQQ